jgi:hypothetical protein
MTSKLDNRLINWFWQSHSFFLVNVVNSLYLVFGRSRWLVITSCKKSSLIEIWTLRCLNIYAVKNENCEPLLYRSRGVLITHESLFLVYLYLY